MIQKKKIQKRAEELQEDLLEVRRHIHQHPELSFREEETAAYLQEKLHSYDIPFEGGIAGTGILARLRQTKTAGPVLLLRAELDALPIEEKSGLPFASRNKGLMHACGHDAHTAMLITAGRMLKEWENEWEGNIYLLFQPGEELAPGGASMVMKNGILQKIKPDLLLAQHLYPELPAGFAGFRPGKYMASSDELFITVKGTGGHAALVQTRTDQVLAAARLIERLHGLNRSSNEPKTVLAIGKIEAAGATNVIPSEVHLQGTFRTFDEKWRREAHAQIQQICWDTARESGIEIQAEIREGYPSLHNHPELTEEARKLTADFLGEQKTASLDLRMSSEDFAFYSREFPTVFYRLGAGFPDRENPQLHHPAFNPNELAFPQGAALLCWLSLNLLKYLSRSA